MNHTLSRIRIALAAAFIGAGMLWTATAEEAASTAPAAPQAGTTATPPSTEPDAANTANAGNAPAAPKETVPLHSIEALQPLLASPSQHYTIAEQVQIDVPDYIFKVTCEHGEYEVRTIQMLLKICHEIDVIETFRSTQHGPQVLTGAAQAVGDLGQGAKTIVFHPVAAGKALVRAPARILRDIGRIMTSPMRNKKEKEEGVDGNVRTRGAKGIFYSKEVRRAAYQLGVDAYTDNINMQALLHSLARQRKIGSLALSFAMPSVEGLKYVKYAATGGSSKVEVERMILENNAYELMRLNAKLYAERLHTDVEKDESLKKLLANPNFSPREQTYLRSTLEEIAPERGLHDAFSLWAEAKVPEEAIYLATQMDLLGILHHHDCKLKELVVLDTDLGAINERKELMVALPLDVSRDTSAMRARIGRALDAAREKQASGIQFWFTGDASWNLQTYAKQNGVTIRRNILKDPMFTQE